MYSPGMLYYVRIFNPVVLVKDLPPLSHSLPYPQAKLLTLSTRAPSLPAFLIVIGCTAVALLLVFFCAAQPSFSRTVSIHHAGARGLVPAFL